jgi:hypothetical protein
MKLSPGVRADVVNPGGFAYFFINFDFDFHFFNRSFPKKRTLKCLGGYGDRKRRRFLTAHFDIFTQEVY